jgi:hypothetical protein
MAVSVMPATTYEQQPPSPYNTLQDKQADKM